jgi:hypothetical protein
MYLYRLQINWEIKKNVFLVSRKEGKMGECETGVGGGGGKLSYERK